MSRMMFDHGRVWTSLHMNAFMSELTRVTNTGVHCTMAHVACVYMSFGSRESIDPDLLERDMYMRCMLHKSVYSQYTF